MSARAAILDALRANRPQVDAHAPPRFERAAPPDGDLTILFAESLARMGGDLVDAPAGVAAALADIGAAHANVCSAVPELAGNVALSACPAPAALASVDLAVVRAALGVADTGSVLLTEAELRVNALGYLAQHLLVLLDPADLVASLHEAYEHPAFRERAYACLHSGPSATADIEGVLIRGAQGVRSLRVLLAARQVAPATSGSDGGSRP